MPGACDRYARVLLWWVVVVVGCDRGVAADEYRDFLFFGML